MALKGAVLVGHLHAAPVFLQIPVLHGLEHVVVELLELVQVLVEVGQGVDHEPGAEVVLGEVFGGHLALVHAAVVLQHQAPVGIIGAQALEHGLGNGVHGKNNAVIVGLGQGHAPHLHVGGPFAGVLLLVVVHVQRQLVGAGADHVGVLVPAVPLPGLRAVEGNGEVFPVQLVVQNEPVDHVPGGPGLRDLVIVPAVGVLEFDLLV